MALHRLPNQGWSVPHGATPTTHIIKPQPHATRFPHLIVNEFLCTRSLTALGLAAAHVEIDDVDGIATLIVTRYDRTYREGRWHRLHQEDLLQALSLPPSKKYQSDGGPGPRAIARELANILHPADVSRVLRPLFEGIAVNVLLGGTDAHAKNYSLMLKGDRTALAPLYDVASYAPYRAPRERVRSAMRIATSWDIVEISASDWRKLSPLYAWDPDEAVARVDELRDCLPAAIESALEDVPALFKNTAEAIAETIVAQPQLRTRGK